MADRNSGLPSRVSIHQDQIPRQESTAPEQPEFLALSQDSPPVPRPSTDSRLCVNYSPGHNPSNFSDPGLTRTPLMMTPNPSHAAILLVEQSRRPPELRRSAIQSDLQGWDYEFSPRPDEKYECPICLMVLRDPMQTMCGHRFCSECINKWLRTTADVRCPVCNDVIAVSGLFADKFANREILSFTIRCPNHRIGCTVTFSLKRLDDHLDSVCGYCEVLCPNLCRAGLLRKDVQYHCDKECLNRMVRCPHCNQRVPITDQMMHFKVCPEMSTSCEHCRKTILRKHAEHHKNEECEERPATCSFYLVGCHTQLTRKTLERHNHSNMQPHLDLLMQKMHQFMSVKSSNLSRPGHSSRTPRHHETSPRHDETSPRDETQFLVKDAVKRSTRQAELGSWEDVGTSVQYQHGISGAGDEAMAPSYCLGLTEAESLKTSFFDEFNEKRRHQDGRLVKHEQQLLVLYAKVNSLEKKVCEQKSTISQKDDDIAALESRLCNGVFYWRIKEYRMHRQEAITKLMTVMHSRGFYTSCYGYKVCIRINLNGVDGGNGSHISIFIHFMRGDFDDVLDWPFQGRIKITILDQGECKRHIVEVLDSKPNLAAFQKPHVNRNHKGFGYIEFAPIELIENSSFVKNDTLIIKAEVEGFS